MARFSLERFMSRSSTSSGKDYWCSDIPTRKWPQRQFKPLENIFLDPHKGPIFRLNFVEGLSWRNCYLPFSLCILFQKFLNRLTLFRSFPSSFMQYLHSFFLRAEFDSGKRNYILKQGTTLSLEIRGPYYKLMRSCKSLELRTTGAFLKRKKNEGTTF